MSYFVYKLTIENTPFYYFGHSNRDNRQPRMYRHKRICYNPNDKGYNYKIYQKIRELGIRELFFDNLVKEEILYNNIPSEIIANNQEDILVQKYLDDPNCLNKIRACVPGGCDSVKFCDRCGKGVIHRGMKRHKEEDKYCLNYMKIKDNPKNFKCYCGYIIESLAPSKIKRHLNSKWHKQQLEYKNIKEKDIDKVMEELEEYKKTIKTKPNLNYLSCECGKTMSNNLFNRYGHGKNCKSIKK